MQRSNKAVGLASRHRLRWACVLLAALGLLSTGCNKGVSDIGVGLPDASANTGAYLIDTLTIRASTIKRDSVITSTSNYLLVGRFTDPLLGTLTAKSYVRLGLPGNFPPDPTAVFDSITLVLKPDTYRYGDTTQTQTLVEVHPLIDPISDTKYSYASPTLTPIRYDTTQLNYKRNVKVRPRPNLTTVRVRLRDDFGQNLLAASRTGRFTDQDAFDTYLPGLALVPAASDNGAIIRMNATAADAAVLLYYHLSTDPSTVVSSSFSLATANRHFFQIQQDPSTAGVPNLPTASLQSVDASATGQRTFIDGALGLQTRLQFPYLTDLQQFGNNLTVTSATLTAQVPANTLTPFVPNPPTLTVSISDALNHPIGTYLANVPYSNSISTTTGLPQGSYQWSIASYCQQVLNRNIPNNGFLVSAATPALPDRAVLGSARSTDSKMQLRLYFITVK